MIMCVARLTDTDDRQSVTIRMLPPLIREDEELQRRLAHGRPHDDRHCCIAGLIADTARDADGLVERARRSAKRIGGPTGGAAGVHDLPDPSQLRDGPAEERRRPGRHPEPVRTRQRDYDGNPRDGATEEKQEAIERMTAMPSVEASATPATPAAGRSAPQHSGSRARWARVLTTQLGAITTVGNSEGAPLLRRSAGLEHEQARAVDGNDRRHPAD